MRGRRRARGCLELSARLATPGRHGTLYAGTSGFAYPDWSPRFYPSGLRSGDLLHYYAGVFRACELNNTFYQQPSETKVAAWLDATPATFRFTAKAQRGGSLRALLRTPDESIPWLTGPLARFGERLGSVLFRVPGDVKCDDERLRALLERWPLDLPISLEFQDSSWQRDETFAELARHDAVLVATELDEDERPPDLRLTGPFLYLRLRKTAYAPGEISAWADRLVPFLAAGHDAFVFFRHDATGVATEDALALQAAVASELDG